MYSGPGIVGGVTTGGAGGPTTSPGGVVYVYSGSDAGGNGVGVTSVGGATGAVVALGFSGVAPKRSGVPRLLNDPSGM